MHKYGLLLELYFTENKQSARRKPFSRSEMPTTNPTCTGLGSNHGFRDEMPATNLCNHGIALSFIFVVAATDHELSKKSILFLQFFFGLSPYKKHTKN
jgi:hypothetical protein